jgi:O-antigen/teichoic acid export membrane protein
MLREYHRFPKYSSIEALANSAGTMLPIIIIATLAEAPEAGFLMLATRVMQAPIGIIGNAVAQVYISRAPAEYRSGNLEEFTASIIAGLLKTGVGPVIFIGILAPTAFGVIFGNEWHRAGELVSWMTPWFVLQLLSSPVSMTLHVTNNQRTALLLQGFGFLLRIGSVLVASIFAATRIAEFYAISGFIFYAVYLWAVAVAASLKLSSLLKKTRQSILIVCIWVTMGLMVNHVFHS